MQKVLDLQKLELSDKGAVAIVSAVSEHCNNM